MRRRVLAAASCAAAVVLLAGCESSAPAAGVSPDSEVMTVYAAASLQASFDPIVAAFEEEHSDVDVRPVVYDGSSSLATQIVEGAPADVFAAADEATMRTLVDAGAVDGEPQLFATNTLVIAVPAGGAGGVADLADLADPERRVVLCAPEVPCGAASQLLLERAGVTVVPDSWEQSVTAVLTKVASGEADAGLVYRTDALGADGEVGAIVPDGAADVVNRYPIAALADAADPDAAAAFVSFVRGARGQEILAEHGFGAP